jgi:hypothetical protein
MENFALALSMIGVLGSLFFGNSFAVDLIKKPVNIPHYQIVLDAQLRCDFKALRGLPWDDNRGLIKLADKVWVVVDDLGIEDRGEKALSDGRKKRLFTLKYNALAVFHCGEKAEVIRKGVGEQYSERIVLMQAHGKPWLLDTTSDAADPNLEVGLSVVSEGATDAPPLDGRDGFTCLVKISDFMRDTKAIHVDQLCRGESKSKRAFTQKEIERVAKKLKARQ